VATTVASLQAEIGVDLSKTTKGLNDLQGQLNTTAQKFKDFGSKAQSIGNKMSVGMGLPLTALGGLSFKAASDAAEATNKMEVVFGEAAGGVRAFGDTAAESLGISRSAAYEAAGTFGNLLTAQGLNQEAAAGMSTEVLQLAADLGSFNNLGTDEVLEKLRAGLVGETEPLRTLGINLSDAAVKAQAMKMGLAESKDELTEADKVQARYALITQQSAAAQGDFARTSDGVANSTKIASAKFEEMQAVIGEKLLPIGLKLIDGITKIMDIFGALSPELQTGIIAFAGLLAVAGPLVSAIGLVSSAIGVLTPLLPVMGAAIAAIGWPITLIIGAITLLALAWSQNWGDIQGKTRAVLDLLGGWFEGFKRLVTGIWDGIVGGIKEKVNLLFSMINNLIRAWNNLSFSLPGVDIGPLHFPGIDVRTPDIPEIPYLARGGIVRRPTLAMVGERGPEAVVPLGAGMGVTVNVYGSVITDRELEDAVVRGYTMALARGRM